MTAYHFVTHWEVHAPLAEVWDVIYQSEQWPLWWKGVVSVTETNKGDERGIGSIRVYKLRSPMYYTLSFSLRLTHRIDNALLAGEASGELNGIGEWLFLHKDGITNVRCIWDVDTTVCWMNAFAFLLKPIFRYNHNVVMKQGATSLAKKLNARVDILS
jgi:Polyketide cyclase / dehydrase and lipid transport.